ncbi:mariner Mos1 transposase [Trichonephila clavipes]|uniref:Mariner Mos1 transposase n=1 Tax=Trichonephila clavipes TaxID=2585209 RepID=A0A8X6V0M1_TRICX|nr:mariner Mos1 transposase [Trichonephila clavipes]
MISKAVAELGQRFRVSNALWIQPSPYSRNFRRNRGKNRAMLKSKAYFYHVDDEPDNINGDFDVEDQHGGGREKVFEDAELEALLDQDSCQTQQELAGSLGVTQQAISKRLKVMGMIQKQGNWVPYELKPRDVERLLFACEQLLERQR